MGSPLQVVTLFADADAGDFAEYAKHLRLLEGHGRIRHFHAGMIAPGDPLARLDDELRAADVVVCLLSADFLADQCLMDRVVRAQKDPRVALIPVRLRAVDLSGSGFDALQTLPREEAQGSPMVRDDWRDRALTQVARELRRRALADSEDEWWLGRGRPEHEDLLSRVERVCALREEKAEHSARRRRRPGPAPLGDILEVSYQEDFLERQYLIAALPRSPKANDIQALAALLREHYRPFNDLAAGKLVHTGLPADERLVREARRERIELTPLANYQGLINFQLYIKDQLERLESDEIYPPALYVPQRMAYSLGIVGVAEQEAPEDALTTLYDWMLDLDAPRFALVLGDFGAGKTFLLHELARRLGQDEGAPVPLLLEMRNLEKSHDLDVLVSAHLVKAKMDRPDLPAFRYMLAEGRIALLLDGFDELALRVSYDRAVEHLDLVAKAVKGKAKVVLTSRTQHFRDDQQVKNALALHIESLPGHRSVRLLPFDDAQIRGFLKNKLRDPAQAEARFRLLDEVKDLLGLSHNPRMLSFIAQLPEERLRAAQERGEVTAAKLYEELLTWWIVYEFKRAHPRGIEPGLSEEERWAAVEQLAVRLWGQTDAWVSVAAIGEAVGATLNKLKDLGVATQQVGAGTLLCRDVEGRFSFIHQSVLEWLVARVAARDLGQGAALLGQKKLSPLMIDFVTDLAGRTEARAWASRVLANATAGAQLKENALLLRERMRDTLKGAQLAGQDLRGQDLQGRDLAGADLRVANLTGVNLSRADLSFADLRGACLREAVLLSANLQGARLEGACLRRAKLIGALGIDESLRTAAADVGGKGGVPDTWGAALGPFHLRNSMHPGRTTVPEVAFSPDGALLAAACDNGAVVLWDVASARALSVLSGHQGAVQTVTFSPDGLTLASGSNDHTIRLWDLASASELRVLYGHHGAVQSVTFSPDGRTLASGSTDYTIRLWDLTSASALRVLSGHQGSVLSVAFSPDGNTLASGSDDDNTVRLWDLASATKLPILIGHQDAVQSVTFSPDGRTLASGSDDHTVRLWDLTLAREIRVLSGHQLRVRSVTFSPDGRTLATGSSDCTIHLWDIASASELRVLFGHRLGVLSVTFSPDGRTLASGSYDSTVRIWDLASVAELRVLSGQQRGVQCLAFSPDGRTLACGAYDHTVRLWDLASASEIRVLPGHQNEVISVTFSPDGRTLASGSYDHTVRLWDLASASETRILSDQQGGVQCMAFSPNGRILASGSFDGTIRIWDLASASRLCILSGHHNEVLSVTFSPDGCTLASASNDRTVCIWNLASAIKLCVLAGHQGAVRSVTFSPDGRTLASGSDDHTINLWDLKSESKLCVLSGHQGAVLSVAFSPDGRTLASGSGDHTIRLWDLAAASAFRVLFGHQRGVRSVRFSPDGRTLASGSDDPTVRLWDVSADRCLAILVPCAKGWVTFTADGRYKLGGTIQGEVWHVAALCRFELEELDPHLPEPLRLPNDFIVVRPAPAVVIAAPPQHDILFARKEPEPETAVKHGPQPTTKSQRGWLALLLFFLTSSMLVVLRLLLRTR